MHPPHPLHTPLLAHSVLRILLLLSLLASTTPHAAPRPPYQPILPKAAAFLLSLPLTLPMPLTLPAHAYTPIPPSELSNVFSQPWLDEPTSLASYPPASFRRLDESPDTAFYTEPRFVEHLDAKGVEKLTAYHRSILGAASKTLGRPLSVLDVCASWASHTGSSPPSPNPNPQIARFSAIGLNAQELKANPALTDYATLDLNLAPTPALPYPSNTFDVGLLQLSVDYLTNPVFVMTEISRVLKPGGVVYVSFSNRVFIQKAVANWTGKPDIEHIEMVGDYLRLSGGFVMPPSVVDLGSTGGDPLYVVSATKGQGQGQGL